MKIVVGENILIGFFWAEFENRNGKRMSLRRAKARSHPGTVAEEEGIQLESGMFGLAEEGVRRVRLDVCSITAAFHVLSSFFMKEKERKPTQSSAWDCCSGDPVCTELNVALDLIFFFLNKKKKKTWIFFTFCKIPLFSLPLSKVTTLKPFSFLWGGPKRSLNTSR